jgi:hypothetical protein
LDFTSSNVDRSLYIEELLYTISSCKLKINNIDNLSELKTLQINNCQSNPLYGKRNIVGQNNNIKSAPEQLIGDIKGAPNQLLGRDNNAIGSTHSQVIYQDNHILNTPSQVLGRDNYFIGNYNSI